MDVNTAALIGCEHQLKTLQKLRTHLVEDLGVQPVEVPTKKRTVSAKGLKNIREGQLKRWARLREEQAAATKAAQAEAAKVAEAPKKRTSIAGSRAISQAQKERHARERAQREAERRAAARATRAAARSAKKKPKTMTAGG
jgi:hypothetical protein